MCIFTDDRLMNPLHCLNESHIQFIFNEDSITSDNDLFNKNFIKYILYDIFINRIEIEYLLHHCDK